MVREECVEHIGRKQRPVRIEDSSCRVEKYVLEMCGESETDEAQH